jgi:glycosyltransferase involved in cell wall biosynthesis
MNNQRPLVSIITVVRNGEDCITKTIESVLSQSYNNIDYVIIDGASKDDTINIIKSYGSRISTFISEPDKGIYDAMNKGIDAAKGEWIAFLNAGEAYVNTDIIEKIFLKDLNDADLLYGNICNVYNDLNFEGCIIPDVKLIWKQLPFDHESLFTRSHIIKKRKFSLIYSLAADYEFVLDCHLAGCRFKYLPVSIVNHQYGVGGASENNRVKSALQRWSIVRARNKKMSLDIYYTIEIVKAYLKGILRNLLPPVVQEKMLKYKYRMVNHIRK